MFLDHVMPGDPVARRGGPLYEGQTTFREVMLGIPCELDGMPTTLLSATWVDRDWAVIMGWLWGSPARLADIRMTRYDLWNAHLAAPTIGQEIRLQVQRYGDLVMRGSVNIDRMGSENEPFFRTIRRERENRRHVVGIRFLPDLSRPSGPPLIHQITTEEHQDTRMGMIWSGSAGLEFGDSATEELSALGPIEVIGGHVTVGGFTSSGLSVLHDYLTATAAPDGIP
jgi:acetoacetate decarboxylase